MTTSHSSLPRRRTLLGILAFVLLLGLLTPLSIALASPSAPVASLSVPTDGFVGEPISFSVSFDNVDTTDPGYGPYIDLILPAAGADGAGAAVDDGITFNSATYLGSTVTPIIAPFICSGGTFTHPLTGLATACTNDTQIVVLQLPFGSFTATQPPASINISANLSNLADVGTALPIRARAGFAYGNDPLLNPSTDPPIVQAVPASASYTPLLFKLRKIYLGPENETATGPNFPRQYRVTVDIANGQTLTNLDLSDTLPNNMQFVSFDSTTINGAAATSTGISTPSTTTPGGVLTRRIASVTGTAGTDDASILFTFYIPRLDAATAVIINPTSGDDVLSLNEASANATWAPIDSPRDATGPVSSNPAGPEHILTDKSIAIQKGVANKTDAANSPGDVLEYTLDIQISDFFAFDTLVVDDTFSDGQHWDASFAPTLQVNGNTYTLPVANIAGANYNVLPNYTPASPAPNDGTTDVQFRLSNELITRGQPTGRLIGGCVSAAGAGLISPCNVVSGSGDGPTTAQIKFRTIILDAFTDDFPSGEPNVDEGDILGNDVVISGNVLNNVGLAPTGQSEVDDSTASLSIARGDLSKTIYAINGVICASQPCTNVEIKPGDTVTYRLQRDVLTTDVEQLKLIDYLPLPIFDVDDNTAPVVSRISSFSTTVSAAAPAAGTAKFGPADTFFVKSAINPFIPATANDSIANSVTFDYGSFNDPANASAKIDLLFTVTANSALFGDGLFLTNQLREQTESTNAGTQIVDAIVQIRLFEPVLNIRKGVVAAYVSAGNNTATGTLSGTPVPGGVSVNAPGACARINGTVHSGNLSTTFTSDLTAVDAGTRVTFAVLVENSGTSALGEFDARVRDALPTGLTFVPGSLCVTDGTGAAMSYTTLGGGLFDSAGGIELSDPGPTPAQPNGNNGGALDPGKNLDGTTRTDGRNIAIITYDATVDSTATTGHAFVNSATLYNYSSLEGGTDHTVIDKTDTAFVTTTSPSMTKTLNSTQIVSASNTNTQAVIGELVTYQLVVAVPEGVTPSARITDTLDSGLAFVDITSVTTSSGVSMSTPISTGTGPANVAVSAGGSPIVFSPGNLTNSNTSNVASTITIVYRAVVLDTAANQNSPATLLNNSAVFSWAGGAQSVVSAANVTVIEPTLTLSKVANPTTGDAGDTITFSLSVANTAAGTTDAFDVALSDVVPTGMTYVPGSLSNFSGPLATLNDASAPTLSATWATLAPASTSVVRFQATLNANVTLAQSIVNSANVQWTSLSGTPGQISTYNTSSTERTGAGGVNDYTRTSTANVTVNSIVPTKSIVTTSETHTSEIASPRPLAVGEIVRYRLAVQLPESVVTDFQIADNLPTGLTFLNDGTAHLAFVSNGSGISSASAQTGAIPAVACANDTGSAATIAALPQASVDCSLADANISINSNNNADGYASGTHVRFKLGTLTNADSDIDAEFVVIEFNALVDNSASGSNDAGDTRTNSFNVFLNGSTQNGVTSNSTAVIIVEPSIPFNAGTNNKTVSPTSGDAGDTVTYTVVYANANGANNSDAFDVRVVDAVPAAATLNLGSVSVSATAPCAAPTIVNSSAGNTVNITVGRVAPNCQITITYQATLTGSVTPGQLITNTANLTYTSLPGPNGTPVNGTGSNTPGAAGTDTGERDGSGGAINDYNGSDTATVTVFVPAPVKSLVSTSETHTTGNTVVVGEIARFRLAVRVGEGSSPAFELRDNMPAGLRFLNDGTATLALVSTDPGLSSATLSGAGLQVLGDELNVNGVTPTFVIPAGAISGGSGGGGAFLAGDDPLLALGSLSNTDNDSDQEFVVVEFNALVENNAGNQSGTSLDNTFTVRGSGSDVATSNLQSVVVAEPNVTTTKRVLSTNGSVVTYQVVATNTGSVTAFNAIVADVLPAALDLNIGSITITPAGGATSGTANHSDPSNRVEFDNLTFPAGSSVTITYQASVVTPGTTIANTAATSYTSLPGTGTTGNPTGSNTPGGSGAPNGERDGSGGTNDYSSSASQSLGSVGDRVWYDVDADGVLDAGEVGIPGVAVTVLWFGSDGIEGNADDSLIATVTNSTGDYLVSGLPLGTGAVNYRVTVNPATLPSGLTSITYDLDNGTSSPNGNTVVALTAVNANPRNADFGYRGTASLGDRVWLDSNGDGTQGVVALEPGLPGAGVTLTWFGFDGAAGGGDDVTYTTSTGANGVYGFANLPSGNFRADVNPATLPDNLAATYDLNGGPNGSASRSLTPGEAAGDVDFGYRGPASIGDTVWNDVDANGVQNNAEPGIPGATVTLLWAGPDGTLGNADDLTYTTTTDASGHYSFPGLPVYGVNDPYRVTVTPPAAYTAQTYDSDGVGTANQSTLNLGASENNIVQDFGYRAAVTQGLSNFVWEDLNGNGRQDGAEPGIDGVTVELYDSTGASLLATTTTAGGGIYSFPGLVAGNYQVKFGVAPGYVRTIADSAAANDATDSDANVATGFTAQVTVTAGAFNTTVDAGLYRPVSIGDFVWFDRDGDGVQDAGEPGIGSATVTVTWYGPDGAPGGGDDLSYFTTTNAAGVWNIPNLPPGEYGTAVSTLPNGLTNQTAGPSTFTLVSGTNRTDIDFGYRGVGSLGDTVWLDLNSNGAQDGGEEGIGGVTVTLTWYGLDGLPGGGDDLIFSTTTAADGTYSFSNLPDGAFRVDVSGLPAGLSATFDLDGIASLSTADASLTAGQTRTDVDFGYRGTGSLGDFVWLDRDGDGVQDAGEPGIADASVTLIWAGLDNTFGNADDITMTTVTDDAGGYLFSGLPAGSYRVKVDTTTLPGGLSATYDLDSTANSTTDTSLTAGQNRSDADFGYQGSGSIGDFVWFDTNGDGVQDAGEPGLGGVDVTVTWYGPDGVAGGGDDGSFTATTAADGSYSVGGLPAGSYSVDVDQADAPGGTTLTTANDPLAVSLTAGQTYTTADFGFSGSGSLGDFVWLDRDGDGVQDAGEPGIADVTVTVVWGGPDGDLATAGDNLTYTTVTNDSGAYQIGGLAAGPYRVTVDTTTLPGGLSATYDLDSTANSTTDTSLTAGQNRSDADFGYQGSGSIGDFVWFDTNGDGVQDAGEPGLGGVDVTVTWYGPDGVAGGGDDGSFTVTTAADGSYSVGGLPAGSYSVDVDQADAPGGTTLTTANDPLAVSLTAGQTYTTADFGFSGSGSLGDFVWLDRDGDGVQDAGEPGIADVTVTVVWGGPDGDLATTGDNLIYTTVTNDSGAYQIGGLAAGPYRVTVDTTTLPGGLSATYDLDSTANSTTDTSLTAGQNRSDADFGYQGSGSIGDRVWLDEDGDGVQDAGEPGLDGVDVTVTWYGPDGVAGGGDDGSFTVTTAADGSYSVGGLPAGSYSVDVDQADAPAGTTLTTANDPLAVSLTAGQTYTTADFGFSGAGAIGDRIWLDLNGDGVQDAGEPGLAGISVTLTWYGPDGVAGGGDDVTYTTTTGANGIYGFTNLPDGAFQLDVSGLPGGVSATHDLDGTASPDTTAISITAGQNRTDADFGYQGSGSIGDLVWLDANGNQAQDVGEPGLNGVDVTVTWAGLDGAFGTTDDIVLIATTDASGFYNVSGLPAGQYTIDVDQTDAPIGTTLTTANDPLSLTLAAGQAYTTADFGFKGTTSLGDRVWNDLNGDGAQQPGELGIAGATVTATWFGADGVLGGGDDVIYTTTTDANGYYQIIDLPVGNYSVTLSGAVLAGLTATYDLDGAATPGTTAATLSVGQNRVDVDFGYLDPSPAATGSIGDRVWNDANGDGVQQIGEPGIAGVTVRLIAPGADGLFGTADDTSTPATTGANGDYSFGGLVAGSYRVQIDASTLPAGLVETFELDGSLNQSTSVSLAAGETRTDVDFGYQSAAAGSATGSIGDRVWNDANGNGIQDAGESGIAAVTVTLTGAGADGLFGSADDTTATTTTGANGDYTFAALPAGLYRVNVGGAPLNGLNETYELDGSRDRATSLTLASGQHRTDVDFGFTSSPVTPATGSIGDRLWLDLDGDGAQDAGEPGLVGVAINLTWYGPNGVAGGGDDLTYTQVTGANGIYTFPNLPAGAYVVTVDATTLPAGVAPSYDIDGGADGTAAVTLASGQNRTDVDFGYQGAGSIGDRVWNDADGDRLQGVGESGIAGVTVTLAGAGADGLFGTADDLAAATTTSAGGFYIFNGLPAGIYRVSVAGAPLSGLGETYELDGSLNGATTVTLAGGQDRRDVDFGFVASPPAANGSIGDRLWLDRNADGVQNAREPGLQGVTVNLSAAGKDGLFGTADDVIYTQITDANGNYNFTSLPAGSYRVDVDEGTLPIGLSATAERDATLDGQTDIALAAGQVVTDADFGYQGSGSLGDRIWLDKDSDGAQDTGEPGLPSVTVTAIWYGPDGHLGGGDDVTFGTTTDANGNYTFSGLPLGNYDVRVGAGLPGGMSETAELDATLNGSTQVSLTASVPNRTDVDFGYTGTGSISQTIWFDTNRDGVIDPTENGISGVTVVLVWAGPDGVLGTADDVTYTTSTDADGHYDFPNLPVGSYTVTVDPATLPPGLVPTYDKDGGTDSTTSVSLSAGQNVPDINFGYGINPTAVTLTSFTAKRQADGTIDVRWETSAEFNTWGFHIMRSSDGSRAHATRVTANQIPHQGRGQGGAAYSWIDTTAQPGETYTYWLVETEINGTTNEYGPAHALPQTEASAIRIYLPLMLR